jgi:hypothetical protein
MLESSHSHIVRDRQFAAAWILNAATLSCGLGLYCIGIDADWLNKMVAAISALAYFLASSLGAVMTIIGLIRKAMVGRWSAASSMQ